MANPKGNPEALRPYQFTSDQDREAARKNGSKGGKRAKEKQEERREIQQVARAMLDLALKKGKKSKKIEAFMDIPGQNITVREAVVATVIEKTLKDKDMNAAKLIAEMAGEIAKDINISGDLPVVIKDDITEAD